MKPSIRLTLAACALAAAMATGCGHKTTATSPASKASEVPAKAETAKTSTAKPASSSPFDLAPAAQPLAGAAKTPQSASTIAAGKALPPVKPMAAKPTADQVIAALEARYRQFSSLKADGSSVTLVKADGRTAGKPQNSRVTLLFARPNKVSINSTQGRFVIDGKSVYTYSSSAKRYTKGKLTANVMRQLATSKPGISVMGLLMGVPYSKLIASTKMLSDASVGGRDAYVIQTRMKSGVACPTGVDASEKIWVAKDDLGIYRSEVTVKYSPKAIKGAKGKAPKQIVTVMTSTLTQFEPNAKLPSSTFTFRPPSGAKLLEQPRVVDMSDKAAADLSFKWTDGTTKKLSDFRGKTVILDFWGLPICSAHVPTLQSLYSKYGRDVVCIFVNVNTKQDKVQEFLKEHHCSFPLVFADASMVKTVNEHYKVLMVPTMFIIDDKGIIREELVGNTKLKDIEAKLDRVRK